MNLIRIDDISIKTIIINKINKHKNTPLLFAKKIKYVLYKISMTKTLR